MGCVESTVFRSSCLLPMMLCSGVVNDDESRTSCLLACLTHRALCCWLGEDTQCVEVVHSCLEKTGSQSQANHLLRLQQQLVLGPTNPGERAVDLQRLWAKIGMERIESL